MTKLMDGVRCRVQPADAAWAVPAMKRVTKGRGRLPSTLRSNSSLVTRAFQDHRRVEGKGATALLASRSPLIDRAVSTLASPRSLSVHASNPQPRARAQRDANRVNRNIRSDADRLHWEHANPSFTACSCERHAPPRLRQMKPRVRRGLEGLNVEGRQNVA